MVKYKKFTNGKLLSIISYQHTKHSFLFFLTHAAQALTIDSSQRLKQENLQLKKDKNDYLAESSRL